MPLQRDGQTHTYRVDLRANPRWRGSISALRFDPCDLAGLEVMIDSFRLR